MLCIAAAFDVRSRKIPDVLWMVFGGIGALLYLWDYDRMTPYHVITISTSIFVGMAIWIWKIAGLADSFAILAVTVILPVHYKFVMMPIMILMLSFFLVVIFVTMYNVSLNLSDILRSKKMDIFSEFSESKYKKTLAFFTVHRKRGYEKFVISAENSISITPNAKSFAFMLSQSKVKRNSRLLQSNVTHVRSLPPLVAYMFGVTVFLLFPEILSMIFQ